MLEKNYNYLWNNYPHISIDLLVSTRSETDREIDIP